LFSTWEVLRDAFIRGALASTNINSLPTKQPGVHGQCARSKHDKAYSQRRKQKVHAGCATSTEDNPSLDDCLQSSCNRRVEDGVAKAVAQEIQLRLTPQQQAELARTRPANREAFDAYFQGYHFVQGNTDKDADMAAKYYERTTQLDPSYALAWVGLSRARNWQVNTGLIPAEAGHRLARQAVDRTWRRPTPKWDGLSDRSTSIGPERMLPSSGRLLSNPEIQNVGLAAFSAAMLGRFDQALPLARRAVDLDPLNAESRERLGEIEFLMGQLDEAAADSKKALALSPDVWSSHSFEPDIHHAGAASGCFA
jgi:tetratricopeptide (TPR) repeat protein